MPDREFKVIITGDATGLASSSKEGAASLGEMGKKGEEAHNTIGAAAEKLGLKHKDLHAGIRALREEFPTLSHIAHLALNPIGLLVGSIAGAFALWHSRTEALKDAFGGLELPQFVRDGIGHIDAGADAWGKYADAVEQAKEQLSGATAEADRALGRIAAELQLNTSLIDSIHEYAKAKLEAQKESMDPIEFAKRKADLDADARSAKAGEERQARSDTFAGKLIEVLDLRESAAGKRAEASGIKIGSKEDDAKTMEQMNQLKDAAQKALEESTSRMNTFKEHKTGSDSTIDAWWVMGQKIYTGLTEDELIKLEDEKSQSYRGMIDRADRFRRSIPSRDKVRARREKLYSGAASDEAKAGGVEAGLDDEFFSNTAKDVASNQQIIMAKHADAYKALAEMHQKVREDSEAIDRSIRTTGKFASAAVEKLERHTREMEALEARVRSLEGTRSMYPPAR